mmetsp:Transcript_1150/g.1701  ORF Transcript_1150/g.1701 Transcript_1150/m.1701 type:complete len:438 (-) Transcript_1150:176-1489(-)
MQNFHYQKFTRKGLFDGLKIKNHKLARKELEKALNQEVLVEAAPQHKTVSLKEVNNLKTKYHAVPCGKTTFVKGVETLVNCEICNCVTLDRLWSPEYRIVRFEKKYKRERKSTNTPNPKDSSTSRNSNEKAINVEENLDKYGLTVAKLHEIIAAELGQKNSSNNGPGNNAIADANQRMGNERDSDKNSKEVVGKKEVAHIKRRKRIEAKRTRLQDPRLAKENEKKYRQYSYRILLWPDEFEDAIKTALKNGDPKWKDVVIFNEECEKFFKTFSQNYYPENEKEFKDLKYEVTKSTAALSTAHIKIRRLLKETQEEMKKLKEKKKKLQGNTKAMVFDWKNFLAQGKAVPKVSTGRRPGRPRKSVSDKEDINQRRKRKRYENAKKKAKLLLADKDEMEPVSTEIDQNRNAEQMERSEVEQQQGEQDVELDQQETQAFGY